MKTLTPFTTVCSRLDNKARGGYPPTVVRKRAVSSDYDQTFGGVLSAIRYRHGLTQRELADRVGLSLGYIGMLETNQRGSDITRARVEELADALLATPAERNRLLIAAGLPGDLKDAGFEEVIRADPRLSPSQRKALLYTYKSMTGPPPRTLGGE